jgi:hypothetical protein
VLHDRIGHKKGKFAGLHQIGEQERIFSPERGWIKNASLYVYSGTANGEPSSVQVAYATIGLEHVILDGLQPQLFGSAYQPGAISNKVKLKTIMFERAGDGRIKGSKAVCLQPGVSVDKEQYRASRKLGASVSGYGNSRARLSFYGQWVMMLPLLNEFRGRLCATIVCDDDFKARRMLLFRQRFQASVKSLPIVVDGYDDAVQWVRR